LTYQWSGQRTACVHTVLLLLLLMLLLLLLVLLLLLLLLLVLLLLLLLMLLFFRLCATKSVYICNSPQVFLFFGVFVLRN